MIKIFTTNKDGKIVITPKELKELLDEAYWDGYRKCSETTIAYTTSNRKPYVYTTSDADTSVTLNSTPTNASASSVLDSSDCGIRKNS